jgi:hypothetical protein
VTPGEFVLELTYDDVNSLHQQNLPHPGLCFCGFDWNRRRSARWTFGHCQVAELWMEFSFQSSDRRQARRERRTGSPLSRMVANRGARLNGAEGAIRKLKRADFDNSEHPAGMD